MVCFGYQEPRKLLDGGGFTSTFPNAPVAHFLLKPVTKCRRTESFACIAQESDYGGGESQAVALAGANSIDQLFQSGAGVAFPEGDPAVEEAPERSSGVVEVS